MNQHQFKKVEYIEPTVHSNQYTSFTIPKNLYKTRNYRLLNFGVDKYTRPDGDDNPRYYSFSAGVYSIIDTITLFNGTEVLCELRNVGQFMAHKNLSDGNEYCYNISSELVHHNLLFENTGKDMDIKILANDLSVNPKLGYVNLNEIIPFLLGLELESYKKAIKSKSRKEKKEIFKNSGIIRADLLDLRILIEYLQTSPDKLYVGGSESDIVNIGRPILAVDSYQLSDEDKKIQQMTVVYDNYFCEVINSVSDPDVAYDDVKNFKVSYVLNSATNSQVRELTICVIPTYLIDMNDNQYDAYFYNKGFCSQALLNESLNLYINEEQLIPSDLCDTPARKAMYQSISRPTMLTPIGFQPVANSIFSSNDSPFKDNPINLRAFGGTMSYLTLAVNDKVQSCKLEHSYTTYYDSSVDIDFCNRTLLGDFQIMIFYTGQNLLTYSKGNSIVSTL